MNERWRVTEGPVGCRDRDNPDPAQRCECHGFGIETTDAIPRLVCWAGADGISPGIHSRADAEAIVAAHNRALPEMTTAPTLEEQQARFQREGGPGDTFGAWMMRTADRREAEFQARRCADYARDNARLRALVKDSEWYAGDREGWCQWCGDDSDAAPSHKPDCPAFTPDGAVR